MKLKIIGILVLFCITTLLLFAVSFFSLRNFSMIEHAEMEEDVVQVRSIIDAELSQLAATTEDYSGWDDTYKYLANHNEYYVKHSLGEAFYDKLRLNLFCILDIDGTLLLAHSYDFINKKKIPLPSSVLKELKPGSPLMAAKGAQGLIALPEGLMMVASRPVLTSEYMGPSRGTLVMGRFLDDTEVDRIARTFKFDLHVQRITTPEQAATFQNQHPTLTSDQAISIKTNGDNSISGYSRLIDMHSRPAGIIRLDKPRQMYLQAKQATMRMVIYNSIFFLLAAFILIGAGRQLVISNKAEKAALTQLSSFIDLAVDGIFRIDRQWRIVNANLQACSLTGYSMDELSGMPFDDLFSIDSSSQNLIDTERLQAGLALSIRRTVIRKGKVSVPVEMRLKILPDGNCQCFMRDCTEQTQWENMLHRQQELLNGIINGTSDIIYAKDAQGKYLLINNAGLRFAGKHPEEMLGLDDTSVFPTETAITIMSADKVVLQSAQIISSENSLTNQSGTQTIFLATRGPLLDRDGTTTGLFAIMRDITLRTMLEKELLEQHNRLGQTAVKISLAEERERVRIAEELHDQVGPNLLLAKMRLNQLQSWLTEEQHLKEGEAVETLINQAVRDIRSLTLQLRPPILANAGFEAALKWLAEEFLQKYGLAVNLTDDESPKPLLYETRTILFQAVRELLMNIVKHADTQTAELHLERKGAMIHVNINDNGVGFIQQNTSDAASPRGYGLFNVTQKLKHIHGSIEIQSTPQVGTQITISAPLDL